MGATFRPQSPLLRKHTSTTRHGSSTATVTRIRITATLLAVLFSGTAAKVRTAGNTNDVDGRPNGFTAIPSVLDASQTAEEAQSFYTRSENNDSLDNHDGDINTIIANNRDYSLDTVDHFDSADYLLGQNAMDYGRGYAFGGNKDGWGSVTMVDGDLEPLEEEMPYFEEDSPTKVTASVGAPAHIPCMVRNLGSKSLSWIRHRDLHVLTVGSFTFANDHRFSAHRDPVSGDWMLVLRQPLPSDSGQYVCSISTKPVKTHSVKLNVVVPSAEMVGGREVFLDYGSTLNLTCLVHYSPSPSEFVLWYHRDKLVNYGGRGGRIEVETVHRDTTTRSSLLVRNATQWHSGRYACNPANAQRVTILVHVLKSETPAAMQTTTSHSRSVHNSNILPVLMCYTLLMLLSLSLFRDQQCCEQSNDVTPAKHEPTQSHTFNTIKEMNTWNALQDCLGPPLSTRGDA